MRGPGRRDGLLAVIAVAGLMLGGLAWAQVDDCVGLQVTPARLEADLRWTHSYDAEIRNCTDEALRVTTAVTGLGHDLDGAPEFLDSSSATSAVQLDGAGTFTLQPGTKRTIGVAAEIARPARSLYAGIVAEFERLDGSTGTTIETRQRVAAMLLMRGPKPWKRQVKVVDIGVTPNGDGSYTVHAAVENTGDVHVSPRGKVRIVKDGQLLTTVDMPKGTILPGFKRRLVGQWTPAKDLSGQVTLNADVVQPPASGSAVIDFSGGEAAVPSARFSALVASDADGAYIEAALRNIGLGPITPTIEVIVTEGSFERARKVFTQPEALEPGADRTIVWRPQLADATYRVTARALQDDVLLDEKVTGLRLGAAAPRAEGGLPLWVLILASFLVLGVVGWLMFVLTRKRSRRPPLPPPPASRPVTAPAPPPADSRPVATPPPPRADVWPSAPAAPVESPEEKPVPVGMTKAVATEEPLIVLRLRR